MIVIIIFIIILLGVIAWLAVDKISNSTVTTPPPAINPIPNFYLKKRDSPWIEDITNSNNSVDNLIEWNGQMDNIINPEESDLDKLASQFRFFAEFWLNKLNVNYGFTNVYDSVGVLGKYEFSRNKNIYTGKFNNKSWTWNTTNYCFNSVNAKRENSCLGGWMFNKNKCFPPATSSSTCSNYDWNTMYNYIKPNEITSWKEKCNVVDSTDCKYPIN